MRGVGVMTTSIAEYPGDPGHPDHEEYLLELGRATYAAAGLSGIAFDVLRIHGGFDSAALYSDPLGTLENRLHSSGPCLEDINEFLSLLSRAREARNDLIHALPVKHGLHRRISKVMRVSASLRGYLSPALADEIPRPSHSSASPVSLISLEREGSLGVVDEPQACARVPCGGGVATVIGRPQRSTGIVAQLDEGAAEAAHHVEVSAPELPHEFAGKRGVLVERSKPGRCAPGGTGDLVVGVVQVRGGDGAPCFGIAELRQRVQSLAAGLRRLGLDLDDDAGEYDLVGQPGECPGQHVAHVEVGFDGAPRDQRLEVAVIGVRARGQCCLQALGCVVDAQRRREPCCGGVGCHPSRLVGELIPGAGSRELVTEHSNAGGESPDVVPENRTRKHGSEM